MSDSETGEVSFDDVASVLGAADAEQKPAAGGGDGDADTTEGGGDDVDGGEKPSSDGGGEEEENKPAEDEDGEAEEFVEWEEDGKKVKVSASEFRKGYLRQEDYTRKTQELSEIRNAWQSEAGKLTSLQQQYVSALTAMIDQQKGAIDPYTADQWRQLEQEDPDAFAVEWAKKERALQQISKVESQRNAIEHEVKMRLAVEHAKQLQSAEEILAGRIPEWSDSEKKVQLQTRLSEYLRGAGYKPEEYGNLSDARTVELAYKAMLYDQGQKSGRDIAVKKVSNAPKLIKPGARAASSKSINMQELDKNIRKTGSKDALAAYFGSF